MTLIVTLWWLLFFSAVGLCLGSFLNVVIYRLPLGLDIGRPRWSFCPHCENRIAWRHNIPVLSFFALRGRCHNCWSPISPRYPLIEITTALVVVALLDAFFVGRTRSGLATGVNLNWSMADDWPVYLGHIVLMASLLAMSAIDLQFYWVDIRFTHLAAACGVLLHTIWTPFHSKDWPRPFDATAAGSVGAFAGLAVVWLWLWRRERSLNQYPPDEDHSPPECDAPAGTNGPCARSYWWLVMPIALFAALGVSIVAAETGAEWAAPYWLRATSAGVFLMLVIVWEASHVRESDAEVAEAIEAEAPSVRRETLRELGFLLPAIALGTIAVALAFRPATEQFLREILHWSPLGGQWRPAWGFATAITGYVIAGGIGWTIRILANLIYAKEAFATGDIHMMAAAGAVAGWPVVALGFVLTCFLAMLGWIVLLPFKRSRVIPLGPWLTLGVLVATLFYRPMIQTPVIRELVASVEFLFFNNSQATAG